MPDENRLESWKEIAAYLGREVRTVQLWEKSEGLPVHRHLHGKQGSVFALKPEIDAWREKRREPAARGSVSRWKPIAAVGIVALLAAWLILVWKTPRHSGQSITAVVVLPFTDFSAKHDLEYLSDGLTEEIIDALSRVPNLRVVARTSAFAFKGKSADVREIGRQLDVNGVIEGSVQESEGQLRITVQLNRVSDGTHLWSRKYDRPLRDVFGLQNEISQAIAGELRGSAAAQSPPTKNAEAWRLYEEGRYFFNQFEPPQSNLKAIERYQQAIQLDGNFALAWAGLSEADAYLAENMVQPPREVMPKAKEAAEKAVALDPASAQTHTALAAVRLDYDWDRDGAMREIKRALELNPGSAWAKHWYAHALEAQGRYEEATAQFRAALALDPLSVPLYWDLGTELMAAGKLDETLQLLKKASELFPNVPLIAEEQAVAYYGKGDIEKAHAAIETARRLSSDVEDDTFAMAVTGLGDVVEGRRAEAARILDRFEKLHQTRYVEPGMVTGLCAGLNDNRREALWKDRIREERSTLFLYMPLIEKVWRTMMGRR